MSPLRFLWLVICFIVITILLHTNPSESSSGLTKQQQNTGTFESLFSFRAPSSLFPPSATISLTDDNSTFFLARPAAFGPLLSSSGLSGQLWIGSGFGYGNIAKDGFGTGLDGELGCSDVPGWSDQDNGRNPMKMNPTSRMNDMKFSVDKEIIQPRRLKYGDSKADFIEDEFASVKSKIAVTDDGTDNYLHRPPSDSKNDVHVDSNKAPKHADIQSLQESAEITGKVVLLSRGGCGFLEKVEWVQRRGGAAVIIADNKHDGPLVTMYAKGDTSNIAIPALFCSRVTAHLLSSLTPPEDLTGVSDEIAETVSLLSAVPSKGSKAESKTGDDSADLPTFTKTIGTLASTSNLSKKFDFLFTIRNEDRLAYAKSWLGRILSFSFGRSSYTPLTGDSRRPPSSGNIVLSDDTPDSARFTDDAKSSNGPTSVPIVKNLDDKFVIGVQDWRDPDLLPEDLSSIASDHEASKEKRQVNEESENYQPKGGSTLPGSGEYETSSLGAKDAWKKKSSWLSLIFASENDDTMPYQFSGISISRRLQNPTTSSTLFVVGNHKGLWVTLTPNRMTISPFFDTLLVLVISPLVTLTVVYTLLLLRSRIRRNRWRAPISVVERLPVRTYHTLSVRTPSFSSLLVTGAALSSPTIPLLLSSGSSPTQAQETSTSKTACEGLHREQNQGERRPERYRKSNKKSQSAKHDGGRLDRWRMKYGCRQMECVICLEEYVDGVSRVMSLPCGHEFHADCITPWLTTRRRTCPICKGDVVHPMTSSLFTNTSEQQQHPHDVVVPSINSQGQLSDGESYGFNVIDDDDSGVVVGDNISHGRGSNRERRTTWFGESIGCATRWLDSTWRVGSRRIHEALGISNEDRYGR